MRNLCVCAALGALLLFSSVASATIIIDDFESGVSFNQTGGQREDAASVIGGTGRRVLEIVPV